MQAWADLVLRNGQRIMIATGLAFLPGLATAQTLPRERVTNALPKLEAMVQTGDRGGQGVPGLSIAVVHNDEVVYLKGFGLREAGKPDAVGADTVFQIALLVEAGVVTTVVAALVAKACRLGSRASADLDPAPWRWRSPIRPSEVTIRDLLQPPQRLCRARPVTISRTSVMAARGDAHACGWCRLAPAFVRPTPIRNAGLTAGALAAVRPTGKSWEDVAEEKLYRPLGMNSTSSRYADFLVADESGIGAAYRRHRQLGGEGFKRDPTVQAPAGGVSSRHATSATGCGSSSHRGTLTASV